MNLSKLCSISAIIGLSAFLSGCGDNSPSEADIQKAMQENIDAMNASLKPITGTTLSDNMKFKLISAKKVSCGDKQDDGSYLCKVDTDIKQPMVGEHQDTVELKFMKGDDGWHLVK